MPKITINDQTLDVAEGTTIIEAFKKTEQDIAHYCWHPGLSIAGVCRLCMVEVAGNPRLQIACNTVVQDGMVVSNKSEKVKDAVRWGLDFHLINHPLDCPICDQAGECELQIQYMHFGKYDPEMAEHKVKKRKVVDLGEKIVLDTERCILCSRCVRFTAEVSKTYELGIFNRGDHSEIGTFKDKPLNNNYSVNTVDICPVGALTSKDFRFRQRVWYLKSKETICPGCSTGCNVKVYYNEEGLFRVKPVYNPEVNGYWMCDKGRDVYKFVNRQNRLVRAQVKDASEWQFADAGAVAKAVGKKLRSYDGDEVALVLTGQYTNEEYAVILDLFVNQLKSKNVFHWVNNPEQMDEFDGLLLRGDRNPNTRGLNQALTKFRVDKSWSDLEKNISKYKMIVVAGPENQDREVFPDLSEKMGFFKEAQNLVWLTAGKNDLFEQLPGPAWLIPQKTYIEKSGTFVNHSGSEQEISAVTTIIPGALTLAETATLLAGKELDVAVRPGVDMNVLKKNYFVNQRGAL